MAKGQLDTREDPVLVEGGCGAWEWVQSEEFVGTARRVPGNPERY